MFTKAFKSLASNKAATSQLLKTTITQLVIPGQAALTSGRFLKKPASLAPKPIFFPPQMKTSFHQPTPQFGFCQNPKPETPSSGSAGLDNKIKEDLSKISIQFETMKDMTLQKNHNFSSYMAKAYLTTGFAMASTFGIGAALNPMITTFGSSFGTFFGGFWASLISLYRFENTPPTITTETLSNGTTVQSWTNSFKRKFIFSSVVTGSAFFLFPLMQLVNPAILPLAALTSMLTMGGSSYYAYTRSPDKFKIWESVLCGSLTGLIGVNMLALIAGPGALTAACFSQGFYQGMGLLTAFQAYNSYRAVKSFEGGNYGHLDHVVDLYQRVRSVVKAVPRNYRRIMEKFYGGPYYTHTAFWIYHEDTKTWEYKFIKKIDLRDNGLEG